MSAFITVSVKFLNGDLLSIQHKPSRGFDHFVRTIYNTCTHIPYGCLVLRRLVADEQDELDEVAQIMLLPDIYSDEDSDPIIVTEVYDDDDEILAMIDPSLVLPYIIRDVDVAIPSSNPKFQRFVSVYSINFCSENEKFESQTVVFHNKDSNTFALCDTFNPPTPQEAAAYHSDRRVEVYKPTSNTVWFPTLSECLLSSMDRFPHDDKTIQSIQQRFDVEDWDWADGLTVGSIYMYNDIDDDDYYNDDGFEYMRENDADHDFRWGHLIDN